jgi:hypothetical protein
MRLENWYVTFRHGFTEDRKISGEVYDHPAHPDGKVITISTPKHIEGKKITTINQSVYILGEPKKDYLEFLEKYNITYDPENPIRFVKRYTKYGN